MTGRPMYATGVSLGGNALLKWLGEQGENAVGVIDAAVAVSAPVDLTATGHNLDKGFNRYFYTANFLRTLKKKALQKLDAYPTLYDRKKIEAISTLYEFDDQVTAPLHGYKGADDYWRRASSKPGLISIALPTLLINARDDPFMPGCRIADAGSGITFGDAGFPCTGWSCRLSDRAVSGAHQTGCRRVCWAFSTVRIERNASPSSRLPLKCKQRVAI